MDQIAHYRVLEKTEIMFYGICIYDRLTFSSEKSVPLWENADSFETYSFKYFYSDQIAFAAYMHSACCLAPHPRIILHSLLSENWPKPTMGLLSVSCYLRCQTVGPTSFPEIKTQTDSVTP